MDIIHRLIETSNKNALAAHVLAEHFLFSLLLPISNKLLMNGLLEMINVLQIYTNVPCWLLQTVSLNLVTFSSYDYLLLFGKSTLKICCKYDMFFLLFLI